MTRRGRNVLLLVVTCLAGIASGELLFRSAAFREVVARYAGRGELFAIVRGVGIYEGGRAGDSELDVKTLVVAENLRQASRDEPISGVDAEMNLLRWQFADEKTFAEALQSSTLSSEELQRNLSEHLKARAWVERQIAAKLRVTDEECREFYEANREQFRQPLRWRASHLFLAAHGGIPAPDVEAKRKAIGVLAARIAKGESLAQLAAELSEDEATKPHGGDLGYFSALRVWPEFLAPLEKLRVGQISRPFQSNLGFHIAQLTDQKPERALSFEEARGEIAAFLANKKRARAVAELTERNAAADFLRPAP